MSFKIPTFWKVLTKFGPFLLLGRKLSVSASHRFSSPDDFFIFSGRSSGELFTPNRKFLVKVLKYLSEQRYPLTSPYTMTKRTTYYSNTTGVRPHLLLVATTGATYRKIIGSKNLGFVRTSVQTKKKGKKPKIE